MKDIKKYTQSDLTFSSLMAIAPPDLVECIERLKRVNQRLDRHPENDAYTHTQVVVDRVSRHCDIDVSLAALLHDEGKGRTTDINPKTGMPRSPGHERHSAQCAWIFSDWIREMGGTPHVVHELVIHHMDKDLNTLCNPPRVSDKMVKHVKTKPWYDKLELIMEADRGGTDIP